MTMVSRGNCHCGSYRFELKVDAKVEQGTTCSCVACTKQGSIWLPIDDITVVRDDGKLTEHANSSVAYRFCSVCGTIVNGKHSDGPLKGQTTVNLRTLSGADAFAYSGKQPTGDPFAWPSRGSCLCGNVSVELLVPLQNMKLKEDNCSICTRNAWIGAYPSKSQVAITGAEHVQDYRFGRKFIGHPFCATCGVHVYMNVYGPPQHIVDRLPEERKAMVRKNLDIAPINLRALEPVRLYDLDVERSSEGQEGYEEQLLAL